MDRPLLVDSPTECVVCVRIARRYMRVGKTCASTLAVGGAGGVALAFLVSAPNLRPDQWLGLLLTMQFLLVAMWVCVWMVGRTLQLTGLFVNVLVPFFLLFEVGQIAYSIVAFPDHTVPAHSSTWWWLIIDGIGWGTIAVLVRELFFAEVLEEFPTPLTFGAGGTETYRRDVPSP